MKLSKNKQSLGKRAPSVLFMLLAIMVASTMWFFVSRLQMVDTQIEINLDYINTPPNLIVTSGLINKMKVRLRGPETLIRYLPRDMRTVQIDLKNIKKGENSVPLFAGEIATKYRAFDIIDIEPSKIIITADTSMERTVPVKAKYISGIDNGMSTTNMKIYPSTVLLRGPESKIEKISYISLPIHLDSQSSGTEVDTNMTLDTPSLVTASPASVRVSYIISNGRTVIARKTPIKIKGDTTSSYAVKPENLHLLIEVPEALAKNEKFLNLLELSVDKPKIDVNESANVKLRIHLPHGMNLTNSVEEEVMVTRLK